MDGQDITSAMDNNPTVLEFNAYNGNNLVLDTNVISGIFKGGSRYGWDVKATITDGGTPVSFANQGRSPVCPFIYGFPFSTNIQDSLLQDSVAPPEPDKPDIIHDTTSSTIAECNAQLPMNKTFYSTQNLVGKRVKIGYFTMTIEEAALLADRYSGKGYINWKPYTNDTIRIAVEFSDLKINNAFEVYEGIAYSRFEEDMSDYVPESLRKAKTWAEMANGYSQYVGAGNYQDIINHYANKIGETNRRVRQIGGTASYLLPLTIGEVAQNPYADIGIIGMVFTPTTARMNLLAGGNIPEANDYLAFVGHGFCFLPEGFGNFGEGSLFLAEDFTVPMPDGFHLDFKRAQTLGDTNSGGTFIKWDDNGFDQARIECDLRFPASMLVKENSAGDIQPGQEVKATFAAHFREWGNWIAMATMDPFQVIELPGYSFTPTGIWYDNSGTVNPDNITFLNGYNGTKTNGWKGLYINNVSIKLPSTFKTFNDAGTRTSFAGGNIIVDKHGFTGDLTGLRLIDLSTGNLGGWNFSMDTIRVELRNSSLQSAWLNGKILLPISDTPLVYRMEMHYYLEELLYTASMRPRDTMNMSLWLAKMHINPNSGFKFVYAGDFPKFDFTLSGGITIELVNTGSLDLSLKMLNFQGITMANHKNGVAGFTMSIGTWAWASPEKTLGPFPIKFSVPEVIFDDTQQLYGLRFGAGFSLADDKIACSTRVDVLGEVAMSMTTGPKAQFKKLQLYDISVSGVFPPVSIDGRLQFYYDDPVYGDGVKGRVVATFPIVTVEATAQFGTAKKGGNQSEEYSYWFVDASVKFDTPVETWPFGIGGFGGGVWYNMKSNYQSVLTPTMAYADTTKLSTVASSPGQTMSGIVYTPAFGFGGVKASITLTLSNSLGGGKVLNGDLMLSCDFNNGRFSSICLEGNVWGLTDYPTNANALFDARMRMVYDHDNSIFSFSLTARAQFLSTVEVTIPVEFWSKTNETKWYLKIGNPNDRDSMMKAVLVDVDLEIIKAYLGATAYFALGNALGNVKLPDIPADITRLLGVIWINTGLIPPHSAPPTEKGCCLAPRSKAV
jgi:hypothetical protein